MQVIWLAADVLVGGVDDMDQNALDSLHMRRFSSGRTAYYFIFISRPHC